jgi:CheY-like chemotaxis protein
LKCLHLAAQAGKYFDLAIIDYQMPGMDGIDLANHIRAEKAIQGTRLLLLSSSLYRDHHESIQQLGFCAAFQKPVRQAVLKRALQKLWGSAQQASRHGKENLSAPTNGRTGPGTRILIAEDNIVNQMLVKRMVEKLGHKVEVMANGCETLDALSLIEYDLILMDCQMPVMDGYQATREIRKRETEGTHLPIVAMTANTWDDEKERCLAAGMDDYITKPIRMEALIKVIQRWIGSTSGSPR